jgi:hypothetical protein
LLHVEYLEQHPDGYRYTQFCEFYRRWVKRRGLSMRQIHRAGEKLFVDYAGQKPSVIDPSTGERISVELFVAVLGASNYTYAEATLTQQVPDWIASHQRAFAFLGGVTTALVCDQLKSGVVIPCRYEPGLALGVFLKFVKSYQRLIPVVERAAGLVLVVVGVLVVTNYYLLLNAWAIALTPDWLLRRL